MNDSPPRRPTTLDAVHLDAPNGSLPHGRTAHRVDVGAAGAPGARRARPAVAAAAIAAAVLIGGCSDRGPSAEVDDGTDSARTEVVAPVFPEDGAPSRALLVEGLAFDLSNRPVDLSYWAAPSDQAECAAEAIVDAVGEDRLAQLGYRPAVDGASLNDIELTDDEREQVVVAVESCVDMTEAVAAMFYGDGRLRPSVATCLAEGLAERDQLRPFVVAVVFGTSVDPFAQEGALATAMLDQSVVCVPEEGFNWSDLDLPDDDRVVDADSPGGVPGSPFVDDQRTTTTTATP